MHMQQFPCNREREHKCVLYWFSGVNYYIVHGGAVSAGRRMMGTGDSGKFNANALLSARILRRLPNRHYVAAADLFILSHSKLGAALKPRMHLTLFPATGHRQRKWEAKWVNFCPAWPESSPRNQSRKKSGHSRGFSHVQWARGEQKGLFLRMWISRLFRSRIPVARYFFKSRLHSRDWCEFVAADRKDSLFFYANQVVPRTTVCFVKVAIFEYLWVFLFLRRRASLLSNLATRNEYALFAS